MFLSTFNQDFVMKTLRNIIAKKSCYSSVVGHTSALNLISGNCKCHLLIEEFRLGKAKTWSLLCNLRKGMKENFMLNVNSSLMNHFLTGKLSSCFPITCLFIWKI